MDFRNVDLRTSVPESGLEDFGIYSPFFAGARVYATLPGGQRQGWTFNPEITVLPGFGANLVLAKPRFTPDPGNTSTLSAGSGRLFINEFGEVTAAGGVPWNPASPDFGGGYTITTKEGIQYRVDGETGKLDHVTDRNGNQLTYSDSGVLSSTGKEVVFERDARGRVTAVIDPMGNRIAYAYSAAGDLASVTDREGNVTSFNYNDTRPHYLDEVIDPLGRTAVRSEYDDNGRLIRATKTDGTGKHFEYDPANSVYTSVDELGNETLFEYDARGNIVSQVVVAGGVRTWEFDGHDRVISSTDPLGLTTTFTYDRLGNELSRTNSLGNTRRFTYGRFGQLTSVVNELGSTRTYELDGNGNTIELVDPLGHVTRFAYDAAGQIIRRTNDAGSTETFEYDAIGNRVTATDAFGNVTRMAYDANGLLLSTSRSWTNATGSTELLVETTEYDLNGNPVRQTNANGDVIVSEYDSLNREAVFQDALGRTTTTEYAPSGQVSQVAFESGATNSYQYDPRGNVGGFVGRTGELVVVTTDALGRATSVVRPDATPADDADNPRTGCSLAAGLI